jgi:hypothetical protein
MELGAPDPVPTLNVPAVSQQLQHCFRGGVKARQKRECGVKGFAVTGADGRDFHDPAGADPSHADVLWSLYGAQSPGDVAAMANLVIACHERDAPLSLEPRSDLTVQSFLIRFHRREEVGPLLLELPKKGFWVCRASAWMSTPSRSSSPRRCCSTASSGLYQVT